MHKQEIFPVVKKCHTDSAAKTNYTPINNNIATLVAQLEQGGIRIKSVTLLEAKQYGIDGKDPEKELANEKPGCVFGYVLKNTELTIRIEDYHETKNDSVARSNGSQGQRSLFKVPLHTYHIDGVNCTIIFDGVVWSMPKILKVKEILTKFYS